MLLSPVFVITLEDQALISRKGERKRQRKTQTNKNPNYKLCWMQFHLIFVQNSWASRVLISSQRAVLDSGSLCICVAVRPDWYPTVLTDSPTVAKVQRHSLQATHTLWAARTGKCSPCMPRMVLGINKQNWPLTRSARLSWAFPPPTNTSLLWICMQLTWNVDRTPIGN